MGPCNDTIGEDPCPGSYPECDNLWSSCMLNAKGEGDCVLWKCNDNNRHCDPGPQLAVCCGIE